MSDRTSTRLKLAAMLAVAGVHMPTLSWHHPAGGGLWDTPEAPRRQAPRQEIEIERVLQPLPETRQQRRKRERDLAKRARK